jgi:hypothetical protein
MFQIILHKKQAISGRLYFDSLHLLQAFYIVYYIDMDPIHNVLVVTAAASVVDVVVVLIMVLNMNVILINF